MLLSCKGLYKITLRNQAGKGSITFCKGLNGIVSQGPGL